MRGGLGGEDLDLVAEAVPGGGGGGGVGDFNSAVACVGAFCEYGVCECFSACLQDRGYRSVSYSIIHVVLAQLYDL